MSTHLDLGWFSPQLGHLQRSKSGQGSGLAQAIADRLTIDVVLIRAAFIVLSFCGGIGLICYLWATALTPNVQGTRPIDSLWPSFRTLNLGFQKIAVALSAVLLSLILSPIAPLPWLPAAATLLLGCVALRVTYDRSSSYYLPSPSTTSDDDLIMQWRANLQHNALSARQRDYYVATEPSDAAKTVVLPPKNSWLAGLIIATVTLVAGLIAWQQLYSVVQALGYASIVAAALCLIFTLIARHRRLPRLLVGLLAASLVVTGGLANEIAHAPDSPRQTSFLADHEIHHAVAARREVITITPEQLKKSTAVYIYATGANVTVVVPREPVVTAGSSDYSTVTMSPSDLIGLPSPFPTVLEVPTYDPESAIPEASASAGWEAYPEEFGSESPPRCEDFCLVISAKFSNVHVTVES